MSVKFLFVMASIVVLAVGCANEAKKKTAPAVATSGAMITGDVLYRARIALPPNAIVTVRLEDVSRADAPATVLAEKTIATNGRQVPIPYELPYNPAVVVSKSRYTVRASIQADDRLLFTSTTAYPVLTGGAGNKVEIMVDLVGAPAPAGAASGEPTVPDVALKETYWKLTQLNGQPVIVSEKEHEAYMVLRAEGDQINGSTGINRMFGSYKLNGDQLKFSPGGMTMMAGPEDLMKQEFAFNQALSATKTFRTTGRTLELLDGKTVLAKFEAVALR